MTDNFFVDNHTILQQVLAVSRHMAETRELEPLLNYVMEQSIDFTKGQHGYLVLINEDKSLDFRVVYGEPDRGPGSQGPVSRTIIEQVINERQPVLIKNALQEKDFSQATSVMALRLRSVLCVPLISRQVLMGVIYIENRHAVNAFNDDDIPPMMIFASQAAVAIHNAQLNQELQLWAGELEHRVEERTAEVEEARFVAEHNWEATLEENRQRTALLGNIAHDLRSPLNTAVSALTMMIDGYFGELNSDQEMWINRSLAAVQQVLRLATDVFDLTKIEQGRLSFSPETINPMPVLEETLSIAEGLKSYESEVRLALDVPSNLPAVYADADRVRQILVNLLSNALKFTKEGEVIIRAKLTENNRFLMISVSDTGAGIPESDLPFIFERFRQAANQEKSGYKGTGLGLAICKQLVEQHGGEIGVESVEGEGTTFWFTLPLGK